MCIRDSFTEQPDFYAEPWKLRRSLDSSDIEIMDDWFFNMGGRGSLESRGSRQKNALLSAGLISILGELYGDQFQTLILASQPERLGEWRRILQDSLGLTRDDFGPNSGIVLFERRSLKISSEISSKDLVDLLLFGAIFLFWVVFFLLICFVLSFEIDLSIFNSFSGLLSEISVLVI